MGLAGTGLCTARLIMMMRGFAAAGLHRGMLILMMRGLCGRRLTKRPADADDARLLWAQTPADADDLQLLKA